MKIRKILKRFLSLKRDEGFDSSTSYWERRYRQGRTSGTGSEGKLAQFKARILNEFVVRHGVKTIVEFGCGDGQQLELSQYPDYLGIDVSEKALDICREKFAGDVGKQFLADLPSGRRFDLSLSLDVIYHLVEDAIFENYMHTLFSCSDRWVGIYSSDLTQTEAVGIYPELAEAPHVRHRIYSDWIAANAPGWHKVKSVPNALPFDPQNPDNTSLAHFNFYEKRG